MALKNNLSALTNASSQLQRGTPSEGEARSSAIRVVATMEDLSRLVLHGRKHSSTVSKQVSECLAALCVLSRSPSARAHIRSVSGRALLSVFEAFGCTTLVLQGVCDLVWSMAYNDADAQGTFAATGVTAKLLTCAKANSDNVSLMKSALGAVSSLCRHPVNQEVAATEDLTNVLLRVLECDGFGDMVLLQYALDATASIAHSHVANSKAFADANCFLVVTNTLKQFNSSAEIVRSACIVLVVLRECENGSKSIVENNGIEAVIAASKLHLPQPELQHIVCALVGQLVREVPTAAGILIQNRGVQTLLNILKHYAQHWMIAEACCLLLINITRDENNFRKFTSTNGTDQTTPLSDSNNVKMLADAAENSDWSGLTQVIQLHRKRPNLVVAAIRTMAHMSRFPGCAKRLHASGGTTSALAALAHIQATVGADTASLVVLALHDKRSVWVAPTTLDDSKTGIEKDFQLGNLSATTDDTATSDSISPAQQVFDILLATLALLCSRASLASTVATATNVCAFVSGPDSIACMEGLFGPDGEYSLAALQARPAVASSAEIEWAASGVVTILSFMQHPRTNPVADKTMDGPPESSNSSTTLPYQGTNLILGNLTYGKTLPMVHSLFSYLSQELLHLHSRNTHQEDSQDSQHRKIKHNNTILLKSRSDAVWPRLVTESLHWLRQSRQTLRSGSVSACSPQEWNVVTSMCRFLACALQSQRQAALRSMASGGGVTLMLQLQRQCRDLRKQTCTDQRNTGGTSLKVRKEALLDAIVVVLRSIGNGSVSTATPYSPASLIAAYSKIKSKRKVAAQPKCDTYPTGAGSTTKEKSTTIAPLVDSKNQQHSDDNIKNSENVANDDCKENKDALLEVQESCGENVASQGVRKAHDSNVDEVQEGDDDDDDEEDDDSDNMSDTSSEEEDQGSQIIDEHVKSPQPSSGTMEASQVTNELSFHVPNSAGDDTPPGLGNFVVKLPMLIYDTPAVPEPYTPEEEQLDPTVAQARSIPQEIDLSSRTLVYDWEFGQGQGKGSARSKIPPALPYTLLNPNPPLQDLSYNFLANPLSSTFPIPDSGEHCLYFESRFESANLLRAIKISDWEYDLVLRSDIHTKAHHQWFYFAVANTHPPGMEDDHVRYKFNIVNFTKPNSMFNYGMKPVRYSFHDEVHRKQGWRHSGDDIAYFGNSYLQPAGGKTSTYFTLTFTMVFKHPADTTLVAMCYPYSYSKLQHFLMGLNRDKALSRYFRCNMLCQTPGGLRCDEVSITDFESSRDDLANRRAIVFTARVHPGEVNASFMMEGTIRFLVSTAPLARILRQKYIFKIIPMLNPDGVYHGNTRVSLAGCDLNRMWGSPNAELHPEIYNAKKMIRTLQTSRKVSVYVDFHGHSRKKSIFMYGVDAHGGKRRSRDSANGGTSSLDSQSRASSSLSGSTSTSNGGPITRLFSGDNGTSLSGYGYTSFKASGKTSYVREYPRLIYASPHSALLFSYDDCSFHIHKGHDTAARVVMVRELGIKASYTLEASFCGPGEGTRDVSRHGTHFASHEFGLIGVGLCDALLRFHDSGAHAEMLATHECLGVKPIRPQAKSSGAPKSTVKAEGRESTDRKRWLSSTREPSSDSTSETTTRKQQVNSVIQSNTMSNGQPFSCTTSKVKKVNSSFSLSQFSDVESDREKHSRRLTSTQEVHCVVSSNQSNNHGYPETGKPYGVIEHKPSLPSKVLISGKRSGRRGRGRGSKKYNYAATGDPNTAAVPSSGKTAARKSGNGNNNHRSGTGKKGITTRKRSKLPSSKVTGSKGGGKTNDKGKSGKTKRASATMLQSTGTTLGNELAQVERNSDSDRVFKKDNRAIHEDHDTVLAKRVGAASLDAARRRNSSLSISMLGYNQDFHVDRNVATKLRNAAMNAQLIQQASLRMGVANRVGDQQERPTTEAAAKWTRNQAHERPCEPAFNMRDIRPSTNEGKTTLPACRNPEIAFDLHSSMEHGDHFEHSDQKVGKTLPLLRGAWSRR